MPRNPTGLLGFSSHRKEDKHFFISFYFLVFASAIGIILCAWGNARWFTIISASVLVSIASFLSGVLLGFIFGFPYSENEKQNKSFKDVTEWLTKIIIGLGLVELKKIYYLFNIDIVALSDSLKLGANFSVLFGALIIAYIIMGFLIGYCVTITEIFKRIVRTNLQIDDMKSKKEFAEEIIEPVLPPPDFVTVSKPPEKDDDPIQIEESSLKELIGIMGNIKDYTIFDISQLKKLAGLLYKAERYEMAEKAYEAIYEKDNSDYFSLLNAGYILSKKLLRHEQANQLLDKLIQDGYGGAYYNKACNYIRMNDFEKAKENIKFALTNDATLYALAEKDEELSPIHAEIKEIFAEIHGK